MDKSIKKTVRKKLYKSMSVSELVTARKELLFKMEEIDSILVKAVEAINGVKPINNKSYSTNSDPAFMPAYNTSVQQNQVPISTEAPIMAPVNRTAPDQSSGFSIFDAESFAQQQAKAEEEYLANNPSTVVENVDFDFNTEDVAKEIKNLKKGITDSINDAEDITTTPTRD
jgi:hypothetical protein